jgi:PAS domain S-box-containing protein
VPQQQLDEHLRIGAGLNGAATLAPPVTTEPWSAEELAATLDAVGTGVWALDLEGSCVFINQEASRILGYAPEECLGRKLQCLIHRGHNGGWACPEENCAVQKALKSGVAVHVDDDMFRRRDGISLPMQYSVQPVVVQGRTRGAVISFADLTPQKRAESALAKTGEWLRMTQEAAGVGLFEVDLETGETVISVGQAGLMGLDATDGALPHQDYQSWRKMVHPEDLERLDRQIEAAHSGCQPSPQTYRVIRQDGSIRWLQSFPVAFFDEAGRATRLVGANVDITSRVQAETALDQFFSASPTPLAIWGIDGRVQHANAAWESILGFTPAEVVGMQVRDLVHPDEYGMASAEFERLVVGGKRTGFECRGRCKDGTYRWLLISAAVHGAPNVIYVAAKDITTRRAAEDALQESRAKFQELFENAPVAYHELDTDGVVRAVNRAECALLGYQASEMVGRPIWDFMAEAEAETSREAIRRKLSGGRPLKPHVRRFLRRDGSEALLELHDTLSRNAAGDVVGIRSALLDITERERAKEALQMSEARLRLLSQALECVDDCISITDTEDRFLYVNEAFFRTYGYRDREVIGKHVGMVRSARPSAEPQDGILSATLAGGWRGELWNRSKEGREFPISLSASPVYDGEGRIVALVGIARDITESKRADEALRESERRFKLITETIGEVFWMNDPELRKVLYISPAYDRIWGRSRTDAYEHPESFLDAIHPDDREEALTGLAKLQTGAPFELGFRIVRPDGAVVSIWDQAFPVRDATGKLECYVGIARDVSERKRLEDTIRSRSEELARSNEELERFAYVASHDLQEPLRMVASFTQLLSRKYSGKLDETADRYINFAVDGAKRMQQLITDLLAFSRINSRDLDLRPTECDRVVRLTLQNLKVAIDESGAAIECDPLPVLLADAGQLGQMFQNLIGNAIKFRGETPPRIHIAAADRGAEWEFSVRDNGIGIDPKHADRIFQIFQRLHTREQYPGTGIGLAVCKKTVERHGGRLWVESQPGGGSTFLFTMPKAPGNGAGNGTENVR